MPIPLRSSLCSLVVRGRFAPYVWPGARRWRCRIFAPILGVRSGFALASRVDFRRSDSWGEVPEMAKKVQQKRASRDQIPISGIYPRAWSCLQIQLMRVNAPLLPYCVFRGFVRMLPPCVRGRGQQKSTIAARCILSRERVRKPVKPWHCLLPRACACAREASGKVTGHPE